MRRLALQPNRAAGASSVRRRVVCRHVWAPPWHRQLFPQRNLEPLEHEVHIVNTITQCICRYYVGVMQGGGGHKQPAARAYYSAVFWLDYSSPWLVLLWPCSILVLLKPCCKVFLSRQVRVDVMAM